jgi:uncharacterized membrane protein
LSDQPLRRPVPLRARLTASLAVGVAAAVPGLTIGPAEGALIGIAVAGVVFVVFGWAVLWRLDSRETEAFAGSQDPGRTTDELVVVGVALASLGGIAAFLVADRSSSDTWAAAVAVLGVAMAWASLHLMYASRYAKLYYASGPGTGIDFNFPDGSGLKPSYRDFLYFSYNLGMTYQVSDTAVTSSAIRGVVLVHCLLSYVFGTAILATTINLVLGALTG